jgi:SepF-like predicted cell division protein (DUF552 family)
MAFSLKKLLGKSDAEEYVEIDINSVEPKDTKVIVKPYMLKQYDDINEILNSIREGYTIAIIDIKVLKSKDVIELKRAVAKIKKTVDAIEGAIAGFGENIIIVTPKFAQIHKTPVNKPQKIDFIN